MRSEWGPRIREFLRDETGLRIQSKRTKDLSHLNDSVEITFIPDKNHLLVQMIDREFINVNFDEYSKLSKFVKEMDKVSDCFKGKSEISHIESLKKYCNMYFEEYKIESIMDRVFNVKENGMEVWGSYKYPSGQIEIYYLPILIFSKLMNILPEITAVVVMAHELAHAYHHLGKDKDGNMWNSYFEAESKIKEGLAQFYTLKFVEDYENQYPVLRQAYTYIIAHQTGEYRIHENWVNFGNENVRLALLIARISNIAVYDKFLEQLTKSDNLLHPKPDNVKESTKEEQSK